VASSHANFLEQKKLFTSEKSSTSRGLVWNTNMAAVSLFWNTNMAAVTSCENALFTGNNQRHHNQKYSLFVLSTLAHDKL